MCVKGVRFFWPHRGQTERIPSSIDIAAIASKNVQRDLQIGRPIGLGELPGANVDLDRRQSERWHVELCVTVFSEGHVFLFGGAFLQLDIGSLLLGDGRHKSQLAAAG